MSINKAIESGGRAGVGSGILGGPGGPAPQQYSETFTTNLTVNVSKKRSIGKTGIKPSISLTQKLVKSIRKTRSVSLVISTKKTTAITQTKKSVTIAISPVKKVSSIGKKYKTSLVISPVIHRNIGTKKVVSIPINSHLAKKTTKVLSGSQGFSGVIKKKISSIQLFSIKITVFLVNRIINKVLNAIQGLSGTLSRFHHTSLVIPNFLLSISPVNLSRQTHRVKSFLGSISPVTSLKRLTTNIISGVITSSVFFPITYLKGFTFSLAIAIKTTYIRVLPIKVLSGSISPSGILSTERIFYQILSGSISLVTLSLKFISRGISIPVIVGFVFTKIPNLSRLFTAGLTISQRIPLFGHSKQLVTAIAISVQYSKIKLRLLTKTVSWSISITENIQRSILPVISLQLIITGAMQPKNIYTIKTLGIWMDILSTRNSSLFRTISAPVILGVKVFRKIPRTINAFSITTLFKAKKTLPKRYPFSLTISASNFHIRSFFLVMSLRVVPRFKKRISRRLNFSLLLTEKTRKHFIYKRIVSLTISFSYKEYKDKIFSFVITTTTKLQRDIRLSRKLHLIVGQKTFKTVVKLPFVVSYHISGITFKVSRILRRIFSIPFSISNLAPKKTQELRLTRSAPINIGVTLQMQIFNTDFAEDSVTFPYDNPLGFIFNTTTEIKQSV